MSPWMWRMASGARLDRPLAHAAWKHGLTDKAAYAQARQWFTRADEAKDQSGLSVASGASAWADSIDDDSAPESAAIATAAHPVPPPRGAADVPTRRGRNPARRICGLQLGIHGGHRQVQQGGNLMC